LDVGCGSGRYAEIASSGGAYVVALDYSSAVHACWSNLKHHPNLYVVQGDIYAVPFADNSFDFLYSLGVLEHTSDVQRAFSSLPKVVSEGGRICVDYYEKTFLSIFLPKYWLRNFSKRLGKQRLFVAVKAIVPILLSVSRLLARIPIIGKILKRLILVANYEGILHLSNAQLHEWAVLDTFDWLSPAYDQPQTMKTAYQWLQKSGLIDFEVFRCGHLVARGRKK